MKRLFAVLLVGLMVFALAACKDTENTTATEEKIVVPDTTGGHFVNVFLNNSDKSLHEIADAIISDSGLGGHTCTVTDVSEGVLKGFGNAEIAGFKKAVLVSTRSVKLPFLAYVFELEDGTDAENFKQTLKDNVDLKYNGITSADEIIVQDKGDKVVVIITPDKIDKVETEDESGNPVEGEVPIAGQNFDDSF